MHHDPTGGDAHDARTMMAAELAERVRPLLSHTDAGWNAGIDPALLGSPLDADEVS